MGSGERNWLVADLVGFFCLVVLARVVELAELELLILSARDVPAPFCPLWILS